MLRAIRSVECCQSWQNVVCSSSCVLEFFAAGISHHLSCFKQWFSIPYFVSCHLQPLQPPKGSCLLQHGRRGYRGNLEKTRRWLPSMHQLRFRPDRPEWPRNGNGASSQWPRRKIHREIVDSQSWRTHRHKWPSGCELARSETCDWPCQQWACLPWTQTQPSGRMVPWEATSSGHGEACKPIGVVWRFTSWTLSCATEFSGQTLPRWNLTDNVPTVVYLELFTPCGQMNCSIFVSTSCWPWRMDLLFWKHWACKCLQ